MLANLVSYGPLASFGTRFRSQHDGRPPSVAPRRRTTARNVPAPQVAHRPRRQCPMHRQPQSPSTAPSRTDANASSSSTTPVNRIGNILSCQPRQHLATAKRDSSQNGRVYICILSATHASVKPFQYPISACLVTFPAIDYDNGHSMASPPSLAVPFKDRRLVHASIGIPRRKVRGERHLRLRQPRLSEESRRQRAHARTSGTRRISAR